jgi:Ran GTPase-activating protein (RanGAP) involved in mRNA processing and transport
VPSTSRDLNLEGNGLRAGVGALAKSLGLSRSIKRLGLGSNRITADDAAAVASLAHAAAECTSLAELDLAGNALCEDGARALLEALRASPHLMRVRVAPHISAAVFRELCALAAAHRALAEPRGKRRKGGAGKKKGKR